MNRVLRAGANLASAIVGVALVATAIGAIVLARSNGPMAGLAAAGALQASALSADELRTTAAAALDAALAKGGGGITFQVVQRNTLYQKPGGPAIEVRSDTDPTKVVGSTDQYYINAMVSTGAVTDSAFWMEIRRGPGKDEAPDFTAGELRYNVIERAGVLWRNDGKGWYQTDVSPGMGMDPVSARKLPDLLRALQDGSKLEATIYNGRLLAGVGGVTGVDDYPGVVASDGKEFTDGTFGIRTWFDDQGRLVRLEASAHNLNADVYNLVSQTVVTFGYGSTGDPPAPTPTMAPEPLPTSEPEAAQVPS